MEILYYSNILTQDIREVSQFYMKMISDKTSKIQVR